MEVYSNTINSKGYFNDSVGFHGTQFQPAECPDGFKKPNYSPHVGWKNLPKDTRSLALVCIDHDADRIRGFSWNHWLVANIDPAVKQLPENAGLTMPYVQGVSSLVSNMIPKFFQLSKEGATGFGGFGPPDRDHTYTIDLYALDVSKLDLKKGFFMSELLQAMKGHVLAHASVDGLYRKV